MSENHCDSACQCKCPHHYLAGVWVLLIGLDVLLGHLGVLSAHVVGIIWPVCLMLLGLHGIVRRSCKCCAPKAGQADKCC